ncbi:MAG: hypothetical protein COB15_16970 [Flavobacteriales bacterium]|nr:MAG: hypothetical protein COB15_16970 [Flavobacteriales bacterium]
MNIIMLASKMIHFINYNILLLPPAFNYKTNFSELGYTLSWMKVKICRMKNIIFTIIFTLLIGTSLFSQNHIDSNNTKWSSNNIIKTELIQSVLGLKAIEYERVVTKKFSLLIAYSWGNLNKEHKQLFNDDSYSIHKLSLNSSITGEIRYYASNKHRKIPAGFHIGPRIQLNNITQKVNFYNSKSELLFTENIDYILNSLEIIMGPQLLIKKLIVIDFQIGLGYGFLKARQENNNLGYNYEGSGAKVSIAISCGIAFGR